MCTFPFTKKGRIKAVTKREACNGKPYAGNPHVRFDDGEDVLAATSRRGPLFYTKKDVIKRYGSLLAMCMISFMAEAVVLDSSYTIVLPNNIWGGVGAELKQAADVLQGALKEGSGLELKSVVEKKFKGGRAIYIGEATAKRAGLVPSDMKDFTSVIAEKGGDIYLFGHDRALKKRDQWFQAPMPSIGAIARFMEDFLNVRFLMPGDIGTDIPKIEKVEVPDGTFSRKDPRLEYSYSAARHRTALYDYANGFFGRGRYFSYGGHTYPKACPPSKYYKSHPEYFGLIGGKRHVSEKLRNPTLCISNPEVQELLVDELKRKFDAGFDVVQLAQQDGWQFCECEKCKEFGGPEAEYIGEKIWKLHRDIAERLLKERPGKIVHILCYSATLKPPKTFRKFPANVMIELCHISPEQLAEWKNYEVPKGFTAYIYLWGGYQPLGYTPKRSWMHCRDFAKMMVDYGIHGVYRCGYGELFGLEGLTYWVFNHAIENPDLDVDKVVDEYCLRAFGPETAPKMRKFYETLDRRLRVINLMEGGLDGGALRLTDNYRDAQIQEPMELFAFIYTPTVVKTMEEALAAAECLADTPKRKKRLELVRTEFNYAKNLGQIATLYSAFRVSPTKGTLAPLLDKIDERNSILDYICSEKDGRAHVMDGWPEIRLFRGVQREVLHSNGRLLATLGAPVGWDTKMLRESGVLPGASIKTYKVPLTVREPAIGDFESGEWAAAEWASLAGKQLEKVEHKARFKVLAGKEAIYVAMESDLADSAQVRDLGRDYSKMWQIENCDMLIAAGDQIDKRCHFTFSPIDGAFYDARFGFLKDPLDPYFRTEDPRWNGPVEAKSTRGRGKWKIFIKLPYSALDATVPKVGDVWRFNIGRDTNKYQRPSKPVQLLWNPNLQSRLFTSPYAMGRLEFK